MVAEANAFRPGLGDEMTQMSSGCALGQGPRTASYVELPVATMAGAKIYSEDSGTS